MKSKLTIAWIAFLVIPLALYFVPYSYALSSSSYTVQDTVVVPPHMTAETTPFCNTGDYVTGGGYLLNGQLGDVLILVSRPFVPGTNPSGWNVQGYDQSSQTSVTDSIVAYAVCQRPVMVAGIGVPEFGNFYIAI